MTTPEKTVTRRGPAARIRVEDFIGQKFGRLTVLGPGGRNKDGIELWRCLCDCGKEVSTSKYTLRYGLTRSCGCLIVEGFVARSKANTSKQDLTGRVFGRLTVICLRNEGRIKKTRFWLCRCECGKETIVSKFNLLDGMTKSCGCWHRDDVAARATTHGQSKTRTYHIWQGMVERCLNPKCHSWPNYGGRGISVCPSWMDFENFLRDVGECPPGLSIDRFPNNDGNYELGNTRWATAKEQAGNRRPHRWSKVCKHGHVVAGDNVVMVSAGKGKGTRMRCRICLRNRQSAWQIKHRMEKINDSK